MNIQASLYPILQTIVSLAVTTVLGFLAAYIKSHFSAKQIQTGEGIAKIAVTFAEQVATKLGLDGAGKYQAALSKAEDLAGKYGLKLTGSQWQGLIESAVNESKKYWGTLTTPVSPEKQADNVDPVVTPVVNTDPLQVIAQATQQAAAQALSDLGKQFSDAVQKALKPPTAQ